MCEKKETEDLLTQADELRGKCGVLQATHKVGAEALPQKPADRADVFWVDGLERVRFHSGAPFLVRSNDRKRAEGIRQTQPKMCRLCSFPVAANGAHKLPLPVLPRPTAPTLFIDHPCDNSGADSANPVYELWMYPML